MKVLVTVKQVAALREGFSVADGEVDPQDLAYAPNEWDEYAVEAAVRLAEAADGDAEVVAVTIGPERSEEVVRRALAKGVDRAVRVWDDDVAAAGFLDVASRARLLAAVAAEENPDVVFAGAQASDTGFGATGVALAEELGFGWAAVVSAVNLDGVLADGVARVRRELEGGVEELVEVGLPAVLTVQTGIYERRYASLGGIREAHSKAVARRSLSDLGLDAAAVASDLSLTGMSVPEAETETTYFEGDAGEQVAGLAAALRERGVGGE